MFIQMTIFQYGIITYIITVSKAIKILNYFITEKKRHLVNLKDLEKSFFQKESFEMAEQLRKNLDSELDVLGMILMQLTPKCKHPKKYQDRTNDENLYCMNCNIDL